MNKIENLLKQLCPNGIKYKKIEEVVEYEQPTKYIVKSTNYDTKYNIPVLTAGQSFVLGYTNETDNTFKATKEHPVIIFDDFTTSFHWVDFEFKVKSSAMKILKIKDTSCDLRYIYYTMKTIDYLPRDHARQWISTYSQFNIPIPPIDVQKKIIDILDNFSMLIDELSKEKDKREKQYEYYRNLIFTDLNNYEEYLLGDVVEFINGKAYKQEELLDSGKYKVLRVGNFGTNDRWYFSNLELEDDKYCSKGDLLYLWSATFGPQIWNEEKTIFHYHIWKLKFDESKINKMFLYYFLDYDKENLKSLTTNSTMPHISMTNMKTRVIRIPPMIVQKEIVEKLSSIYKLANSNSVGIPAEIEARQKQYEYYRDKLLTFKELVNEG